MQSGNHNPYFPSQHRALNQIIQCSNCQQFSPDQFILLLCDHVFCSTCLYELKETQTHYDSIKCICGLTTHFKSSNNTSLTALQRNSVKGYRKKSKVLNQRNSYSHKKDRIRTQINSFIPEYETEKRSLLEKSNYRLNSGGHKRNRNHEETKEYSSEQTSIFSKPQRLSQNYNTMNLNKNNGTLTDQFVKEIQFLQMQYEKQVGGLKLVFKKVLGLMEEQFKQITSHLKDICLERMVSNISKTEVNIPKIIKQKYNTYVGMSLEKINQFLRNFLASKISYELKTKKRQSCDLSQFQREKDKDKEKDIRQGKLQKKGLIKKRNWVIQL